LLTIADLPFRERPLLELLNLDEDRDLPAKDYAGFGWAHVDELWLAVGDDDGERISDALVLALHSADDGEALADDIELEFELPDGAVTVLASDFLARWLPKLPPARAVVLALCNSHDAALRRPPAAVVPIHYGLGDVASWRDGDRVVLTAETWCTL
jgi:hypothetical protein